LTSLIVSKSSQIGGHGCESYDVSGILVHSWHQNQNASYFVWMKGRPQFRSTWMHRLLDTPLMEFLPGGM
jgi:hypothetical protein